MAESTSMPLELSPVENPLTLRVRAVLDTLRPLIQWDGGDIDLVDVSVDGVVRVRFRGACIGCPSSVATLRLGIEKNLREKVPEITRVIPVDGEDS